jgi:hypothetical protein
MVKRKKGPRFSFKMGLLSKILPLLLLTLILWFFRPWFHDLFMLFYTKPVILELLIVWFILHKLLVRGKKKKLGVDTEMGMKVVIDPRYIMRLMGSICILIVFLIAGFTFASIMPQVHVVNELNYVNIDTLPETKENIRLMPLEVAYRYSRDSLQLSQYKLGTENIALVNGSMMWMFPLVPDGTIIQFTLKNKGVIFIDATTQERTSQMVQKDLNIGEGMQLFDNLWWNIYKTKYLVNLDDPYYVPYKDDIYTVVSATSYSFHQFLGLVYTVPRFGGVFLINSDGNVNFLTPEEAKESPILKDNRIFPEDLTRFYIESYKYNRGVLNRFLIHEDQIEIRDVVEYNRQPYLMDTEEGLKWFISTEPQGESHGVFKIFLTDAITGEIEMYELPIEETLTGPLKATDFVRQENPTVDWTRFKIVEPLPFITKNILYWKVVVIPYDAAGIAYQAFVNSKTNDVVQAESDADIQLFIKTGETGVEIPETVATKEDTIKNIQEKLKEIEDLIGTLE